MRPGDALAEDPALEPELASVTDPGTLQAHRAARRLHRPFLIAVAVTDRLTGALIAAAAQELCELVLQRLLQDQPGTETADRLNRILLAGHAGQHLIQLVAKPLARGYLLHAGVPPSLGLVRTKRRLRPQLQIPRLMRRDLARVDRRLHKRKSYPMPYCVGRITSRSVLCSSYVLLCL
jgi:hypothetical protein